MLSIVLRKTVDTHNKIIRFTIDLNHKITPSFPMDSIDIVYNKWCESPLFSHLVWKKY